MFTSKIAKVIGKVDTFISDLKEGIEINEDKIHKVGEDISKIKIKESTDITTIRGKACTQRIKCSSKQCTLNSELIAARALLTNLTKLKG